MNGTGKVSFARKIRRHATGPAVRTGAGGAGNMRAGGPGCGPGGLVRGCLGVQVGGEVRAAVPSCFPVCTGPRKQTTKAGGRS